MSLGKTVGKAFVHVQHTVDNVATWGFAKLEKASKEQSKEAEVKTGKAAVVKKYLRKGAGFLGETGSEYYQEYEKLKQKQKKKASK